MRGAPIALFTLWFVLAPAVRAGEPDLDPLTKVLHEVEELRKLVEKEAEARVDETNALRASLGEAKEELRKAQKVLAEQKNALETAETEMELLRKNNATLEKLVATLEKQGVVRPVEEPPAAKPVVLQVHGKITSIADAGLIVVAVGLEDGVKQGQILDVHRQGEPAKKLGAITLVRAYHKQSIGQFKPAGSDRPEVGDEVVGDRIEPKDK
jgi:hypothetical protein